MKLNKKVILLFILILILPILVSCGNKKAPEGVSQDFYDDMIVILSKLGKTKGEIDSDNGEDIIEGYEKNEVWLNKNEKDILSAIQDLHYWVWSLNEQDEMTLEDDLILKHMVEKVSVTMSLDINIKKFKK